ncbi:MAG: hypothetical protein ACYTF9_02710 [Planctomycetota bacterium]|jgi:hypothetical protein
MDERIDISPERLIDAADAIFEAAMEMDHPIGPRTPSEILGAPDQPRALCDFSRFEIVEAERFLVRCGALPAAFATPGPPPS